VDIDREISDRIGRVDDTLNHAAVDSILDHPVVKWRPGKDRLAYDVMLPARNLATGVDASFDPVQDHRPVEPAFDIIFARPYEVDWGTAVDCLGHRGELGGPIAKRVRAPPKAAAAKQRVDLDLFRLKPKHLRGDNVIDALSLAT
jgi:hypothetical protein